MTTTYKAPDYIAHSNSGKEMVAIYVSEATKKDGTTFNRYSYGIARPYEYNGEKKHSGKIFEGELEELVEALDNARKWVRRHKGIMPQAVRTDKEQKEVDSKQISTFDDDSIPF